MASHFASLLVLAAFALLAASGLSAPSGTFTATNAPVSSAPADPTAAFDHANKLYEQSRFAAAAQSYQALLKQGAVSPALHFNAGNALFKSGQIGQALYHYRLAERLAPRDPDIQANLAFARRLVRGGLVTETPWWSRFLTLLSLDDWTVVAAAGLWLWLLALAAGQCSDAVRRALSGYTATLGVATLLAAALLGAAWFASQRTHAAVVIVPEAVVRFGPLEESQSAYTLRDGSELEVLDEKDGWLQVLDDTRRAGWVRREQVLEIKPEAWSRGSATQKSTRG